MEPDVKVCSACLTEKPTTKFHRRALSGDGLASKCKACRKVEQQKRYGRVKEKILRQTREYRLAHPEMMRDSRKRWNENNPEKSRECASNSSRKNAWKHKEYRLAWRRRHREVRHRYRANKKQIEGAFSFDDLVRIFELQRGLCFYCRATLGPDYQIDHRIPVSRGGSNDSLNIALTCRTCNQKKNTKTDVEFMLEMASHAHN